MLEAATRSTRSRSATILALAKSGRSVTMRAVASSSRRVRSRAVACRALGMAGRSSAARHLTSFLLDEDPFVRFCAYEALRHLTGQKFFVDWMYGELAQWTAGAQEYARWCREHR